MKKLSYLYGETTCFSANFTFVNTFAVVLSEETRRIVAGWSIMFTCVGAFLLSYAASSLSFPGLSSSLSIFKHYFLRTFIAYHHLSSSFKKNLKWLTGLLDIRCVVLVDVSSLLV